LLSAIIALGGIVVGHVIPVTWFQTAIGVWRFLFCVCVLLLLAYGSDRYVEKRIAQPLRAATDAISSLSQNVSALTESISKLSALVGQHSNSLAAIDNKLLGINEKIANVYTQMGKVEKRLPDLEA